MRWLLIVFLASLAAMLLASAGLARHIWRQRSRHGGGTYAPPEGHEEPDARAKR